MVVNDLFSWRKRGEHEQLPDTYTYHDILDELRTQIIYIIQDVISDTDPAYQIFRDILCREYGLPYLVQTPDHFLGRIPASQEVLSYFLQERNVDRVLDVIELIFDYIGNYNSQDANHAISELNERFKRSDVGYRFENGQIIRIDSEFIHSEIIKPVLGLLLNEKFSGANQEFLSAHEHYRHARYKECITDCCKAFESVLKVIRDIHQWKVKDSTAKRLIDACVENGLFPHYMESQISSIRSLLESGVPTLRNKSSAAHGQGTEITHVDENLARYAMHLTATSILFLVEQNANKK